MTSVLEENSHRPSLQCTQSRVAKTVGPAPNSLRVSFPDTAQYQRALLLYKSLNDLAQTYMKDVFHCF